jgi:hypothetical protein
MPTDKKRCQNLAVSTAFVKPEMWLQRGPLMFVLDMAFFFGFLFLSFGIIVMHRAHSLHNTTRKGAVDGTYWGAYSHKVEPIAQHKDHGPRMVNGKLVLPKIVNTANNAAVGKSTYAGRK